MKNLPIGQKLALLFSVILALIAFLGYFSWDFIRSIEVKNADMQEQSLPALRNATNTATAIAETRLAMQQFVLQQSPETQQHLFDKLAATQKILATAQDLAQRYPQMAVYGQGVKELTKGYDQYSAMLKTVQDTLTKQQQEKAALSADGTELLSMAESMVEGTSATPARNAN